MIRSSILDSKFHMDFPYETFPWRLEVNKDIDERYNLKKSTEAACKYLQKAYDKFGSWTLAAASYNMGINGVQRQVKKQNTNNYFNLYLNDETSRYVFRIIVIKDNDNFVIRENYV